MRSSLAVLAAVLAFAIAGMTPTQAFSPATQRACKADYKKLCPSYKIGSSDLRYCMESNARSISEKCIRAAADNGDITRSQARLLGFN
jgi:hypothetical protein